MLYLRFVPWLLLLVFSACTIDTEDDSVVEGYRPMYISNTQALVIESQNARTLQKTGKIYAKDTLVFVNELYKGVHIINNKNPQKPVIIGFISIPGNVDIAIKNNVLYADNYTDLVAIDINNLNNIRVVKRIKDAFPEILQKYPPYPNVRFECVDDAKGRVIGWEKATLTNPKCIR
jgi:hypothetical protein